MCEGCTLALMRITTTVLSVVVVMLMSGTAFADTLCFRLAETNGYTDFKLDIKPNCKAVKEGQSTKYSAVHGTGRGHETGGGETESFLIMGTCESRPNAVWLGSVSTGAGPVELTMFGPSLETATATLYYNGSSVAEGQVVPVSCSSLGL
jgi:hypothetical protein